MGLAALGDLVLTCTDDQSRNRRLGLLARPPRRSRAGPSAASGQVVEGVTAAVAVRSVAERLGADVPICLEVYRVMHRAGRCAPACSALAMLAGSLRASERERPQPGALIARSRELAPGLIRDQRHRVRQIEAARTRLHGNEERIVQADARRRRAPGNPRLSGPNTRASPARNAKFVAHAPCGFHRHDARAGRRGDAGVEIGMDANRGQGSEVVESGRLGFCRRCEIRAASPDAGSLEGVRAQSDHIAGIRRNLARTAPGGSSRRSESAGALDQHAGPDRRTPRPGGGTPR